MVEPGWYPDPEDADRWRWWDGESWTEHVSSSGSAEGTPDQSVDFEDERSSHRSRSRSGRRIAVAGIIVMAIAGAVWAGWLLLSDRSEPIAEPAGTPADTAADPSPSPEDHATPASDEPEERGTVESAIVGALGSAVECPETADDATQRGQVLSCQSGTDNVLAVFVADGRFQVQSATDLPASHSELLSAAGEEQFCRDFHARGEPLIVAVAYWFLDGAPDRMDADRNGIPCETVYDRATEFFVGGESVLEST